MPRRSDSVPIGSASLFLAAGVSYLDEEEAVFSAMLEGWRAERVGGPNLTASVVRSDLNTVQRFRDSAGAFPWSWSAALFDEWMDDLVTVRRLAPSTVRGYQNAVAQFCDFSCSPHYDWVAECPLRDASSAGL